MKLSKEEFINQLNQKLENIGISTDTSKLEQLYLYKELLIEWNEKINLTAITDDEEIISKHFVDSALALKHICNGSTVIDVGTGAGLPGVVIAILNENIQVTLLDALQKRIVFLDEVVSKLNLKNAKTIHARAEEQGRVEEYRECFDYVISRAVASLNVLMELTVPYVKVNGMCIYMKADRLQEEMQMTNNATKVLGIKLENVYCYDLEVSGELQQRKIAIYSKKITTPIKYARQFGKIKKQPL